MTNDEYRKAQAISNSDLGNLERYLFNTPPISASKQTLNFGVIFHQIILEPQRPFSLDRFSENEIESLHRMYESIYADDELKALLYMAETEVPGFWTDEETRLPCKRRTDAIVRGSRHLIDLKTTSCKNEDQFLASMFEYNYHHQAAFYLDCQHDGITPEYFEFVGIQKVAPYKLFRFAYHKDDEFTQKGRKRVRQLLTTMRKEFDNKKGWRPYGWDNSVTV